MVCMVNKTALALLSTADSAADPMLLNSTNSTESQKDNLLLMPPECADMAEQYSNRSNAFDPAKYVKKHLNF